MARRPRKARPAHKQQEVLQELSQLQSHMDSIMVSTDLDGVRKQSILRDLQGHKRYLEDRLRFLRENQERQKKFRLKKRSSQDGDGTAAAVMSSRHTSLEDEPGGTRGGGRMLISLKCEEEEVEEEDEEKWRYELRLLVGVISSFETPFQSFLESHAHLFIMEQEALRKLLLLRSSFWSDSVPHFGMSLALSVLQIKLMHLLLPPSSAPSSQSSPEHKERVDLNDPQVSGKSFRC
eukprot:TRINITY_DN12662_c0_g1_i1.p1 TRINITY_DN12662_c0_g1~~TRINITY_DN12662_c0_g1_i1.p1  ORF type:complete len:256 (-),score=51.79 TRINITY_DN12662_c0_g1_i1:16-720(-)